MKEPHTLEFFEKPEIIAEQLVCHASEFQDQPQNILVFERLLALAIQIHTASMTCKWDKLEKASNHLLQSLHEIGSHPTQITVDQILSCASHVFEVQNILRETSRTTPVSTNVIPITSSQKRETLQSFSDRHHLNQTNGDLLYSSNNMFDLPSDQEIKKQILEEIRARLDKELNVSQENKSSNRSEHEEIESKHPSENLNTIVRCDADSSDMPTLNLGSFFKIKVGDRSRVMDHASQTTNSISEKHDTVFLKKALFPEVQSIPHENSYSVILNDCFPNILAEVILDSAQLQTHLESSSQIPHGNCSLLIPIGIYGSHWKGQITFLFPEKVAVEIASRMLELKFDYFDSNVQRTVCALTRLVMQSIQKYFSNQQGGFEFIISNILWGENIQNTPEKTSDHHTFNFNIPTVGCFNVDTTIYSV